MTIDFNLTDLFTRTSEVTERVVLSELAAPREIRINGQSLVPDKYTAFVEFHLAHGFPVTTVDGFALHPQVVANSYRSLLWKPFDFAHMIRSYDPESIARDRIVGCIVGVEFPEKPLGGWKVQGSRSAAPGIRAVAAMFKAAEGVDRILGQFQSGRKRWTVSREMDFAPDDCGFLVRDRGASDDVGGVLAPWRERTPEDLRALGWCYIPIGDAPADLLGVLSPERARQREVSKSWQGRTVLLLLGGLDGQVMFKGTGLTPVGKENEAEIAQMLASEHIVDAEGLLEEVAPEEALAPLRNFSRALAALG